MIAAICTAFAADAVDDAIVVRLLPDEYLDHRTPERRAGSGEASDPFDGFKHIRRDLASVLGRTSRDEAGDLFQIVCSFW